MPLSVSRLAQQVLRVKVQVLDEQGDFVEEDLKIVHRPVTMAMLNRWKDSAKTEDSGWSIVDELAEIIVDMDLVDDAGKPVKPSKKLLESIDLGILQTIHGAVMEAIFPNAKP